MGDGRLGSSNPETRRKVVVIGAGLGGMTAALELARAGFEVLVLEKNDTIGGKLGTFSAEGFSWDTGPSVLTMPHLLRELWADLGRDLNDYLTLIPLEPASRHRWTDGTTIDVDEALLGRRDVGKYLRHTRGLYRFFREFYWGQPIESWRRKIRPRNLLYLRHYGKVASPASMQARLRRFFRDRHVGRIFAQQATALGSSPFRAPASANVGPGAELGFGAHYVKGGLHEIAKAFARLAGELGVRVATQAEVTGMRRLPGGFSVASRAGYCAASAIICNEDALSAAGKYLGLGRERALQKRLKREALSLSGFVLMLGLRGKTPGLAHRNIFYSENEREEFTHLFREKIPAENPTIHLTVSSITDPDRAPDDAENWLIHVAVPPLDGDGGFDWEAEAAGYAEHVLSRLEKFGLGDLRARIVTRAWRTPLDFQEKLNAHAGSLYGFAAHGTWSAFRRPGARVEEMPGLYLAGGSTHPGGGLMMAVQSGRIAARELQRDQG